MFRYLNYIELTSVTTKDLPPENNTEFSPHQFPEYTYWAREDRQYYRLVGLDDCADGDVDDDNNEVVLNTSTII